MSVEDSCQMYKGESKAVHKWDQGPIYHRLYTASVPKDEVDDTSL